MLTYEQKNVQQTEVPRKLKRRRTVDQVRRVKRKVKMRTTTATATVRRKVQKIRNFENNSRVRYLQWCWGKLVV